MKLLLIEDNRNIAGNIFDFFELRGYCLDYAKDGLQGFNLARDNHYDLILLDVMLPRINGLQISRDLRYLGVDTPILMLTAMDRTEDILLGFEHGADDYLIKPFDLNILEARVNALYRRKCGLTAQKTLSFGELELDQVNRLLVRSGCRFSLNHTLFTIMKILMLKAPDIATRAEIISEVWQNNEPEGDVLRRHIYQLRGVVDKPFQHNYIRTIPKKGYQLIAEDYPLNLVEYPA